MNRAGKTSGGGFLLLFGVVLLLFVAQYVATKPAVPAAAQAISRFVKQDRRQTAIGSQETKEGYVIDPALAQRMLADTAIQVRVTGIRGFSNNVIACAAVTVPGADGSDQRSIRYFAMQRSNSDWSATGEVKARDWYIKLW